MVVVTGCDTTVNEADTSSTSTTINNPPPGTFDASGTVTGRVLDRVTSSPVEGVTVSLAAAGDSLTATTDASGKFSLSGVPVNTSSSGSSSASTSYSVHITTPDGSNYRDFYRSEVELQFGDTANSGGSANNLAASVTFPLSKLTASVTGRAFVDVTAVDGGTEERPLNGAPIAFVQQLPISFDAEGNPQSFAQVQTAMDTTDADGNFTFENVEEGTDFDAVLKIGNEDAFLFDGFTPTSQSGSSELAVGDVDATGDVPAFKITRVSPRNGADVSSQTPTITFTFNRPLAENSFVQSGPNDTGTSGTGGDSGGSEIADELFLFPEQAKSSSKATNPDNFLPIEVSINDDRTQLSVTPREPLDDGFNYFHQGAFSPIGNGQGFADPRFTDANGIPVQNATEANLSFSVGADNSAPPVPSVTFQDGPPTINYTTEQVTANLQVDVPSDANVKGYEVYYRTQDIRAERDGAGNQFVKATNVSPEAAQSDFEQSFGIIPADAAEFGTLNFSATISGTPLAADGGSYGPIEWKFRAVSVNNVRGDFTDVIETGDNAAPLVINASATDEDGDGNDEFITVGFTEAMDPATASDVANYTVTDGTGSTRDVLGSVTDVDNVPADENSNFNLSTVTISLDDGTTINPGDEIEVADAVLDLSTNNGVSQDGNDNSASF